MTTFIDRLFAHLANPAMQAMDAPAIQTFLAPSASHFPDGIRSLTEGISKATKSGDQLDLKMKKPLKVPITVAGMAIELEADELVNARVHGETLALSGIKGLRAGMGFMKMDLTGVRFHPDGRSYLVDLQTPMKTFNIKIPAF